MTARFKIREGIRKSASRRLIYLVVFLMALLLLAIWFVITWNRQQQIADNRMEQLREDIVLTQEEELTEEERTLLFDLYTEQEAMSEFKETRKKVFLERMNSQNICVLPIVIMRTEQRKRCLSINMQR
ncbi:MAG: hypothetical protein E7260_04025 [Lachnospiraceae bacterium]|nr:hypothetical protein [Lachnospiraceae bacterium]